MKYMLFESKTLYFNSRFEFKCIAIHSISTHLAGSSSSIVWHESFTRNAFIPNFCLLTFWIKNFQITFFCFLQLTKSTFSSPGLILRKFYFFICSLEVSLEFFAVVWQYCATKERWKICNFSWLKTFLVEWHLNYLRFRNSQWLPKKYSCEEVLSYECFIKIEKFIILTNFQFTLLIVY